MCGHFSLYASAAMDSLECDPCGHKSDCFLCVSYLHSLLWFSFRLNLYPFIKKLPVLTEHITLVFFQKCSIENRTVLNSKKPGFFISCNLSFGMIWSSLFLVCISGYDNSSGSTITEARLFCIKKIWLLQNLFRKPLEMPILGPK